MKRFSMVMVMIAVLWSRGESAFAQQAVPNAQAAQNFFAKGNTAYNLGHFDEAADLFSKAYEAWPQPEFLYNIAQAYRLGRNCKQALHFYKRFRSLKDQDTAAPLSQKKKDEVEKFITEATECVANADRTAVAQPDTIVKPQLTAMAPTTAPPGAPATTAAMTPANAAPPSSQARGRTAALEPKDDEAGDDEATQGHPSAGPKLLVAHLTGGVALISAGDLGIPAQPVLGLAAGYPVHLAPVTIEIGAALSYTPLPYATTNGEGRGTMLGVRATVVASYPVIPKLSVHGHLGFGVESLSGLEAGNPIVIDHNAGSFILPSIGLGVAADYEITPYIVATASPFNLILSRGVGGMYANSLREIDMVVGIGYRR